MFVVLALFGVASLVGTEDNGGAITKAAEQFGQSRDSSAQAADAGRAEIPPSAVTSEPSFAEETVIVEFTPDDDLVQDPSGFDPNPIMPDPEAAEIIELEPAAEE